MPDNASNVVEETLKEVLNEDNAESQSASKSNPEVAAAVKNVIDSDDESASDDETDKSTDKGKESETVPRSRLSQVVQQRNELREKLKNLEDQFKTSGEREKELRTRVGDLEQDRQILEAIKNLAQNEKYRDHVVAIDRALQGLDEEIEEAKDKGDKAAESKAIQAFEKKLAELEDMRVDQRNDQLWTDSSNYAKQLLQSLPVEHYTDEDKARIGKLWTPLVDWDRIETEGNEAIPEVLNKSFVEVIKEYGTPQGTLKARTTKEVESRVPEAKVVSNDDALKGLLGKDWAARDDKGNLSHSEEDFKASLADIIRRANSGL